MSAGLGTLTRPDDPPADQARARTPRAPASRPPASRTTRRAFGLGYVPALDGLRGVAVAIVLLFHQDPSWLPGGFLGVSAFFTLSGFLITRLLIVEHERSGDLDLKAFWGRRIRRLWPASLLCTFGIVVLATAGGQGTATQLQSLRGDALSALTSLANWRFLVTGGGYGELVSAPSPFQHFWSLAIEEQFYLVFPPAFLLLLGRRARRSHPERALVALAAAALAGVAIGWVVVGSNPTSAAYYDTAARIPELLIGCLLAMVLHGRPPLSARSGQRLRIGALAAAAVLVLLWLHVTPTDPALFRGILLLHAGLIAVVIVAVLQPGSPAGRALSVEPLRALGAISYGVYLFHWPIFLWLTPSVVHATGLALFLVRLVVTLVVALCSYRLLEQPVRHLRLASPAVLRRALPAAAVVVAVVVLGVTLNPPKGSTAKIALRDQVRNAPVSTSPGSTVPTSPLGRPIKVAFAGDSMGFQVAYSFQPWSNVFPGRISYDGFTADPGCGMVSDGQLPDNDRAVRLDNPACRAVAQRNQEVVDTQDPDVFVVTTGPWDTGDRMLPNESSFRTFGDPVLDKFLLLEYQHDVDVMTAKGAQVVWVDWPCIQPTGTTQDGRPFPSGFTEARLQHLNAVVIPQLAKANAGKLQVVDLGRSLCPGGRFEATDAGGQTLRAPDGMHLAAQGGAVARDQILPVLFAAAKRLRPDRSTAAAAPTTVAPHPVSTGPGPGAASTSGG